MVETGHRMRFAIEALADLLARMKVCVEHLHGHGAAELRVPAPPHHRHSTLPDLLLEPVPAELHYTSRGTVTRVSRFYSETGTSAIRLNRDILVSRGGPSGRD